MSVFIENPDWLQALHTYLTQFAFIDGAPDVEIQEGQAWLHFRKPNLEFSVQFVIGLGTVQDRWPIIVVPFSVVVYADTPMDGMHAARKIHAAFMYTDLTPSNTGDAVNRKCECVANTITYGGFQEEGGKHVYLVECAFTTVIDKLKST